MSLVPQYLITPLVAVISPQSASAGTYTSGWVSLATLGGVHATLNIGAITGSGTVDAKFQQASDSGGTGAKDVTGTAMTQIVGSANSNKQITTQVRQGQMDAANNFTHVRLSVTTAVAASLISAVLQGFDAKYEPQSQTTSVAESVAG